MFMFLPYNYEARCELMPDTQTVQTTVGGLRAVELSFRPTLDIQGGTNIGFISRTHLNTPGLGILMPEVYRPVADSSGLSGELFELELMQLMEAVKGLTESSVIFKWVSIRIPIGVLKDGGSAEQADKMCQKYAVATNEIAFVVPPEVLLDTSEDVVKGISRLRRHGYHMILPDFGDNGCPFLKLSELEVDYAFIAPSVIAQVAQKDRTDKAVEGIIGYIKSMGVEPVADGVKNSTQAETLYGLGCNYCAGPLPGDYIALDEILDRSHN